MQRLCTPVGCILVGDEVARAVVRYAAALASKGRSDSLTIPTVDDYGQASTTAMILGSGIVVMSEWAEDDVLEPDGDALLVELEARLTVLQALPSLKR